MIGKGSEPGTVVRQRISIPLLISWMALIPFLPSCGNFSEDVQIGKWAEGGRPVSPSPTPRRDVILSVVNPGNGPYIRAGDLIQLRVAVTKKRKDGSVESLPEKRLWLWTGTADSGEDTWGNLGDDFFRAKLIGKRVGSRIVVSPSTDEKVPEGKVLIPLYGFYFDNAGGSERYGGGGSENLEISNRSDWGSRALITSEIEILQRCKGKLYRRTSTVSQWGYVFDPFKNIPVSRSDKFRSSALHGVCAKPEVDVWLTTGPNGHKGVLRQGIYTFWRLHPESKYPEDYWRPWKGVPAVPPKINAAPTTLADRVAQAVREDVFGPPETQDANSGNPSGVRCAEEWDTEQQEKNKAWVEATLAKTVPEDHVEQLESQALFARLGYVHEAQEYLHVIERNALLQILGQPSPRSRLLGEAIKKERVQQPSLASLRQRAFSNTVRFSIPAEGFKVQSRDGDKAPSQNDSAQDGEWHTKLSTTDDQIFLPVQVEHVGRGGVVIGASVEFRLVSRDGSETIVFTQIPSASMKLGPGEKLWTKTYAWKSQQKIFKQDPNQNMFDEYGQPIEPVYKSVVYYSKENVYRVHTSLSAEKLNEAIRGIKKRTHRFEIYVVSLRIALSNDMNKPYVYFSPEEMNWSVTPSGTTASSKVNCSVNVQ